MSDIDNAILVLEAIKDGKQIEFQFKSGSGTWKLRTGNGVPDFHNYNYRLAPPTTWTIIFGRGGVPATTSWTTQSLNRAIELATQANKEGRLLMYVIKVSGDVATIQKTPS